MSDLSAGAGPGLGVEHIEGRPTPVLRLTGELDIAGVDTVRAALDSVPSDADGIVFDLSALDFMDSSGIAVLLTARERFGRVQLRRPPDIIRQVLEMTGLSDSLPIVE
jgi:anti-anti-sigma factor